MRPSERQRSETLADPDVKKVPEKKVPAYDPEPPESRPQACYSETVGLCVPRLTAGLPSTSVSSSLPLNDPRSQLSFLASEGRLKLGLSEEFPYQPSFGPSDDEEEQEVIQDLNELLKKPRMPSLPPIELPVITDTRQLLDPRFEQLNRGPRIDTTNRPINPRLQQSVDPRFNRFKDPRLNRNQDPRHNTSATVASVVSSDSRLSNDPRISRDTRFLKAEDPLKVKKKLSLREYKRKATTEKLELQQEQKVETETGAFGSAFDDEYLEDIDLRQITGPPAGYFEPPLDPHHASIIMNPNVDAVKYPKSQTTEAMPLQDSSNTEIEHYEEENKDDDHQEVAHDPDDMAKALNELSDPDDASQSPKHTPDPDFMDPMLAEAMKKLVEHSANVNLFTDALKSLQDSADKYGEQLHDPEFLVKKIAEEIEVLSAKQREEERLKAEEEERKKKLDEERKKKLEEERKEMERIQAEIERQRIENELFRAEMERKQKEAEIARKAEEERQERERLEAERIEKERIQAEMERQRIEKERFQAEIERQRIEAEMSSTVYVSGEIEEVEMEDVADIQSPDAIMSPDHSNDSNYDPENTVRFIPLENEEEASNTHGNKSDRSALDKAMQKTLEELNKVESHKPKKEDKVLMASISSIDLGSIPIPAERPKREVHDKERMPNAEITRTQSGSNFVVHKNQHPLHTQVIPPLGKMKGIKDRIEVVPMDLYDDFAEEDIDLRSGFPVHHNILPDCKTKLAKAKPQIKINLKIGVGKKGIDEDFRSKSATRGIKSKLDNVKDSLDNVDSYGSELSAKEHFDMFGEEIEKKTPTNKNETKQVPFHSKNFKSSEHGDGMQDPFGLGNTEDVDERFKQDRTEESHKKQSHVYRDVDFRASTENSQDNHKEDFDFRKSHSRSASPPPKTRNRVKLENNQTSDHWNSSARSAEITALSQDSNSSEGSGMLFDAYSLGKQSANTKVPRNNFGDVDWRFSDQHGNTDYDLRAGTSHNQPMPYQQASNSYQKSEPFSQLNKSIQNMFGSSQMLPQIQPEISSYTTSRSSADDKAYPGQTSHTARSYSSGSSLSAASRQQSGPAQGNVHNLIKDLDFSNLKNILANFQSPQSSQDDQNRRTSTPWQQGTADDSGKYYNIWEFCWFAEPLTNYFIGSKNVFIRKRLCTQK